MPLTPTDLAELITHARRASGLTMEAAAKLMAKSQRALEAWESGANLNQATQFLNLLEVYGFSVKVVPPPIKRAATPLRHVTMAPPRPR